MKAVYIRKKKKTTLNEAGFNNPFDDLDDNYVPKNQYAMDDENDPVFKKMNNTSVAIGRISLWNTNLQNKILYKDGKIYANKYFCKGDIIEESPVKLMGEKDLYSENIRNCVFPIDTAKGIYALPLGYAVCYRNSYEAPLPGNITYDFDENKNMLVFTAITNIKKGNELVIAADDDDFANELRPGQFKYDTGVDTVYSIKNYKLV